MIKPLKGIFDAQNLIEKENGGDLCGRNGSHEFLGFERKRLCENEEGWQILHI